MTTTINNDFIDGFTRNMENNHTTIDSIVDLFKIIFNDFMINSDDYYQFDDRTFDERKLFIQAIKEFYLIENSKEIEGENKLFNIWFEKFVEHHVSDIQTLHVCLSWKFNKQTPAKVFIDMLSPTSPIQALKVGNQYMISEFIVNKKMFDRFEELKMYYAEQTLNELTQIAKDEIYLVIDDYTDDSKILNAKFNVTNAKRREIIQAKFNEICEEYEMNWNEFVPELLMYGDYTALGVDEKVLFTLDIEEIFADNQDIIDLLKLQQDIILDKEWVNLKTARDLEREKPLNLLNLI